MCGILGGNIKNWDYHAGINKIKHRGPDAQRVRCYEDCTLAFTRLSIMDLSMAAMQPMQSEDGRIVIVFNGEIYGYRTLKRKLETKYKFKTTSDTEVILNAYLEYGDNFIEYIDGMFSIVIYDRQKHVLKLYRDRFGIKPLYYYCQDNRFAFASELKAITAASGDEEQWKADNTAIYDYFFYGYIPEPKSLYQNVYRLEPACCLVYDLFEKRILKKERYWHLHVNTQASGKRNRKSVEEDIRYLIAESVREQMIADVKVGTFLSGGVDSSIVTYESNCINANLSAFSIGFPDIECDETPNAKIFAERYSLNHKIKYFNKSDCLEMKGLLYQLYDEPYADLSAFPTYFLSKFAREEVTVVLTGDGGDEIFGGYNRYSRFCELEEKHWNDNYGLERFLNRICTGKDTLSKKMREMVQTKFTLYCRLAGQYAVPDKNEFCKLFKIANDYDPQWYFKKYYVKDIPKMTRMRYLDFKTYLPSDILTKVDRASMAVSLEARVPLLNRKLVEYVFALAEDECSSPENLKAVLKDAYRNMIPAEILDGKKKGFGIPENYFMSRAGNSNKYIDVWKKEWKGVRSL